MMQPDQTQGERDLSAKSDDNGQSSCPPGFVSYDDWLQQFDSLMLAIKVQREITAELERWKERAAAAEAQVASLQASKTETRFDALRRLLAKELHPDFCTGGSLEKAVRQEIFKVIWPQVEELSRDLIDN